MVPDPTATSASAVADSARIALDGGGVRVRPSGQDDARDSSEAGERTFDARAEQPVRGRIARRPPDGARDPSGATTSASLPCSDGAITTERVATRSALPPSGSGSEPSMSWAIMSLLTARRPPGRARSAQAAVIGDTAGAEHRLERAEEPAVSRVGPLVGISDSPSPAPAARTGS